jgi:hypothetical protein
MSEIALGTANMDVQEAVEHHTHVKPVVDVPHIGLVGPAKPDGGHRTA